MATSKATDHATPNGGVRSEIIYLDDAGANVDETVATAAEIVEYAADGTAVQRTYGRLNRPAGPPDPGPGAGS